MKSIQLLADLLREEQEALSDEETDKDRKEQYSSINTKSRFLREGLCSIIPEQMKLGTSASFIDAVLSVVELVDGNCTDEEATIIHDFLVKLKTVLAGNCEEERDEEPDTQIYCPLLGRMEILNERRESLKDEL